jgi:hypothetical protein
VQVEEEETLLLEEEEEEEEEEMLAKGKVKMLLGIDYKFKHHAVGIEGHQLVNILGRNHWLCPNAPIG